MMRRSTFEMIIAILNSVHSNKPKCRTRILQSTRINAEVGKPLFNKLVQLGMIKQINSKISRYVLTQKGLDSLKNAKTVLIQFGLLDSEGSFQHSG